MSGLGKTQRMTQKELAEICGVSRQLVSAILGYTKSDRIRYTQETYDKVMAAARKYNYRPNRTARSLLTNKHGAIGLIAHRGTYSIPDTLLHFLILEAKARGLGVVQEEIEEGEDQLPIMLREDFVDAIVFFNAHNEPAIAQQIDDFGIPCLKIHSYGSKGPCLNYDDAQGINLLISALSEQQYRCPALRYRYDDEIFNVRIREFQKQVEKLSLSDPVIGKIEVYEDDLLEAFLEDNPKVDSVILQNPNAVGHFFRFLKKVKRQKPVKIMTFHHNSHCRLAYPEVSFLGLDPPNLAKEIMKNLDRLIERKKVSSEILWPYRLM